LASKDYNIELIVTAQNKASKELKKVSAELGKIKKKMNEAWKSVKKQNKWMMDSFKQIKKVIAWAFIAHAVIKFGKAMLDLWTKLDLMDKKASTVLWNFKKDVEDAANSVARSMGMTNTQFVAATANMADLLVPMGMTRKAAVEMATETTKLAGALSEWSAWKYTAAEASEIMAKAMLGETEQLKQMGIKIDQSTPQFNARVQAMMRDRDITLEQAKALDIQGQIFDKSRDAQAAYATGSDSLARKQAILKAVFGEVKEQIARALIPAFTSILGLFVDLSWETEATNETIETLKWEVSDLNSEFEAWQVDIFTYAQEMADLNIRLEEAIEMEEALRKKIREVRKEMKNQEETIKELSKKTNDNIVETQNHTRAMAWEWAMMDTLQWETLMAVARYDELENEYKKLIWAEEAYVIGAEDADEETKKTTGSIKAAIDPLKNLKTEMKAFAEETKELKEMDLDKINTAFEKSFDTVKDLIKEIWNLESQLNKLWEWEAKDVASRFLEIESAIAWIKEWWVTAEEQPELKALQAEKWQAFDWIWTEQSALLQEQIDKQREYNELTGIEKIREDYAVKHEEIQLELDAKTAALEVEKAKFIALAIKKADFEKKRMKVLEIDHVRQVAMYDALIAKAHALAAARASAWQSSWARAMWWPVASGREYLVWENGPEMFVPSSHWKIVPNNQISNDNKIEINLWWVTVANETDIELLTDELARKIELQRNYWIA